MSVAAFIPIKANSERVKGKNFRPLAGKKLYLYILEHCMEAACFDQIYIDTNSDEIKAYAAEHELGVIDRLDWLASNEANGNDLLVHHATVQPNYDYYFQLFATAPLLTPKTISDCVNQLTNSQTHDSIFTATEDHGFYWFAGQPVNCRPGILPRSQDAQHVMQETTGLYGITGAAVRRYHCRIGAKPFFHLVDPIEALDINTEHDFAYAEYVLSRMKR